MDTTVVLFRTGEIDAANYPIYDAFGLSYDVEKKRISYSILTCSICELPIGEWDFQESQRLSMNGYGICANKHITVIGPDRGEQAVMVEARYTTGSPDIEDDE